MPSHETLKQPFPDSLPKTGIKILLLEGISDTAVNMLKRRRLHQYRPPHQGAGWRGSEEGA